MRKVNYIVLLFITGAIFLAGIWVGNYIASAKVEKITFLQENLNVDTAALSLQMELLGTDICSMNIFDLTERKFEIGQDISNLEGQVGYENENVINLKNKYSLYSIQQYLLIKKQQVECGSEVSSILFFYDNQNEERASRTQGYILDYVYKMHGDRVAIFSFDVRIENPAVDTLIDMYKVTDAPTVIIGGEKYEGITTSREIVDVLRLSE